MSEKIKNVALQDPTPKSRNSVFIKAGDGDDFVVGGAANDWVWEVVA